MENVENKILEVLEDVGEKMAPVIKVRKEMSMARKYFLMIVFQNPYELEKKLKTSHGLNHKQLMSMSRNIFR